MADINTTVVTLLFPVSSVFSTISAVII